MKPIAIIGSGMAGYTLAREFRKLNKTTPILILTADDGGFYSKPMLSNAFAQGKEAAQLQSQNAQQMAAQIEASILPHTTVQQIDTTNNTLHTDKGDFAYDKLILALGAQAIRLAIAGDAAHLVLSVNHLSDYAKLRQRLSDFPQGARVCLLGAGLIGCEFANDLAKAGHQITVVDPNPLPMAMLAPAAISQVLHRALQEEGVQFRLNTTARKIDFHPTQADTLQIELANGEVLAADLVLSAVGLRPELGLAQAAQLQTERGILVDSIGRTNVENIFALGDCAQYTNLEDGSRPVLPYIAPIMTAARAIARTLNGDITPIEFKPTPVIIKTPSCPIAIVAPNPQLLVSGHWETEMQDTVTVSRFFDANHRLRGFALAPQEPKLRTSLLAEMSNPT